MKDSSDIVESCTKYESNSELESTDFQFKSEYSASVSKVQHLRSNWQGDHFPGHMKFPDFSRFRRFSVTLNWAWTEKRQDDMLKDSILLCKVSQRKTTCCNCKVPKIRSDRHYKRRRLFILRFRKTKLVSWSWTHEHSFTVEHVSSEH